MVKKQNKKVEDKFKRKPYKLLVDFPTHDTDYKKGDTIELTDIGATHLRTKNKIK